MKKSNNTIFLIVVISALVAALTTVAVFLLRARAKRREACALDAFDYDFDDHECFCEECFEEADAANAVEEAAE